MRPEHSLNFLTSLRWLMLPQLFSTLQFCIYFEIYLTCHTNDTPLPNFSPHPLLLPPNVLTCTILACIYLFLDKTISTITL